MQKGNYDTFHASLLLITEIKKIYPKFSLRINYTFNEDNFKELEDFFTVFGMYSIDTLQLRPITNLGDTAYQNFKMDKIIPIYEEVIKKIKNKCKLKGVTLIAAPFAKNLISRSNSESLIYQYTYCYISPTAFWHEDYDWKNETYNQFARRKKISKEPLGNVFSSNRKIKELQTENLNYNIS